MALFSVSFVVWTVVSFVRFWRLYEQQFVGCASVLIPPATHTPPTHASSHFSWYPASPLLTESCLLCWTGWLPQALSEEICWEHCSSFAWSAEEYDDGCRTKATRTSSAFAHSGHCCWDEDARVRVFMLPLLWFPPHHQTNFWVPFTRMFMRS